MIRMLTAVCVGGTVMWLSAQACAQRKTTQPSASTQAAATEPIHSTERNGTASGSTDLTALSLEDLMNVQVTSVSKQSEKIADAPSAIFVISQEDMARSGFTSIPEALRLAPGLDVAQLNDNTWAVSSRGFNASFNHDLLVVMDGRTVYLPTSSGVYWDSLDYIMPDLDRIEVIRGAGSTIWGANADTGIINIDSKSADQTQGWLLDGTAGNDQQAVGLRYGGKLDDNTYFRVYGKFRDFGQWQNQNNTGSNDPWNSTMGGFRIDNFGSDHDTFTLEGQGFNAHEKNQIDNPQFSPPFSLLQNAVINTADAYGLARWKHTFDDKSDFTLQAYYDYFYRNDASIDYSVNTGDLDFQDRLPVGASQEVIWGGGVRVQPERNFGTTPIFVFNPVHDTYTTANAFVQDDITVVPDRLHAILGTKVEYNTRTEFEYEPSVRATYTPNDNNTFWGAVSRAVRIPSAYENDASLTVNAFPTGGGNVAAVTLEGNKDLSSENLYAFELGYRAQPMENVSFDCTTFFNYYDKLIMNIAGAPTFQGSAPQMTIPLNAANNMKGTGYGAEIAATWNITHDWRLSGSYSLMELNLYNGGSSDSFYEGNTPKDQFQLHSYYNLMRNVELNASGYYVDPLATGSIPAYFRLDLGVTWKPTDNISISLVGQNLLQAHHQEFSSINTGTIATQIPRTIYGQVEIKL